MLNNHPLKHNDKPSSTVFNAVSEDWKGCEFILNFNKLKPKGTQMTMNGSCVDLKNTLSNKQPCLSHPQSTYCYSKACLHDLKVCFFEFQICYFRFQPCLTSIQLCFFDCRSGLFQMKDCFTEFHGCLLPLSLCKSLLKYCCMLWSEAFTDLKFYKVSLKDCLSFKHSSRKGTKIQYRNLKTVPTNKILSAQEYLLLYDEKMSADGCRIELITQNFNYLKFKNYVKT